MRCKEMLILELTEERSSLRERVTEMEEQLQELSNSLLQKERDAEVSKCVLHSRYSGGASVLGTFLEKRYFWC